MGYLPLVAMALLAAATYFPSPAAAVVAEAGGVPAIYVFGDSTVDVGNNNYLPGNKSKANFPFNGIDYPGGRPTGRFCNGYVAVDFIAKRLSFEESPPAYLSITSDVQTSNGVNFASGGSGILHSTGVSASIPMNKQIKNFVHVKRRLASRIGEEAADVSLSKSLFYLSIGSNDLFAFASSAARLENTIQSDKFVRFRRFRKQLRVLYKLGARKFAVAGTSQVGCVPFLRRTTPSGSCIEPLNQLSRKFKTATEALLRDLSSSAGGMSYSFMDLYEFVPVVASEPRRYGFKEIVAACCGSGRLNAEAPCTPAAAHCANREEYLHWDQYHPTTAFYRVVADVASRGTPEFVRPVNIDQLVRG